MKVFVLIIALIPFASISQTDGEWFANFAVAGQSMSWKMTIKTTVPTSLVIEDLDAGFPRQPIRNHTFEGDSILFKWVSIGLTFNGAYHSSDTTIAGVMDQAGFKWDVVFKRQRGEKVSLNRPQEPQPPFRYSIDSLLIKNGDIVLGATLTRPENFSESTPIVVLASGSGAQNRDCSIMGHKPFLVIADYLANNGIACLRFDDRGVGQSTGNFQSATLQDFGSDVVACVKHLRKAEKFKKNPIGVAGHSEGGMHTLIAATSYKKIDFIIQLASVGTNGREVLVEQQYLIPLQSGKSEAYASWNRSVYETSTEIIMEFDQKEANDTLPAFLGHTYDNAPAESKIPVTREQFIMSLSLFLNSEWAREFLTFDTWEYLSKTDLPLLAINGDRDVQVPGKSNYEAFKKYPNATCYLVPELNHLMQTCESCAIEEYGDLEETFNEEVLRLMVDWISNLKNEY